MQCRGALSAPEAIILAIDKVVGTAMNSPKYEQRLESVGAQAADRMPPEPLKKLVAKEYAEIETTIRIKVVQTANIKAIQ
jgi:tripartite-type tricarboxylate transporter receptor subunit TctC